MLPSSLVDHGFKPRSGQTKDYDIGICCFSVKYTALRYKSTGWLALNQDYMSKIFDLLYAILSHTKK